MWRAVAIAAGWTERAPGYAMTEITVAEPALSFTAADVDTAAALFVRGVSAA